MLRRVASLGSQGLRGGASFARAAALPPSSRVHQCTRQLVTHGPSSSSNSSSARRFLAPASKGLAAVGAVAAAAYSANASVAGTEQQTHARGRDFEYATTDKSKRRELFPAVEPYNHGMLKVRILELHGVQMMAASGRT